MNWGPNLDKPYLSFKLAHIWVVWIFLAKNKIGIIDFHFGDHLVPKFIPRRIPWGWTGDQPYLVVKLFHIWLDWSLLATNKIGMLNFNFGNDLDPYLRVKIACTLLFLFLLKNFWCFSSLLAHSYYIKASREDTPI